ncbi:hypothetical protein EVAR_37696_1 [Eumeta japonica]|uniref:Uncharacterized protein n=1 Tax=Eumeta variegata TaxID=151549 RepID=A0A4C1XV09_EUMVA|nr:hypothetical protein EVAR_37696_1 [Eumeta japonica]
MVPFGSRPGRDRALSCLGLVRDIFEPSGNRGKGGAPSIKLSAMVFIHRQGGKHADKPSESRRSPPPMDTCKPKRVTSALSVSWERMQYIMEEDREERREGGVCHRNPHSLEEMQQRKLLLTARIPVVVSKVNIITCPGQREVHARITTAKAMERRSECKAGERIEVEEGVVPTNRKTENWS